MFYAGTEAEALIKLKQKASGVLGKYKTKVNAYYRSLPEVDNSAPYVAGQVVLNNAIQQVQILAAKQTPVWNVSPGVVVPTVDAPYSKAKEPYTPCEN